MKTYCLYHANCSDGLAAAWVVKSIKKNAECIPVHYGEPLPEIEDGSEVYIVDFSYKKEILEKLNERVHYLLVLDHHKTAEEELEELEYCWFDMTSCGARLAWNYFHPGEKLPEFIKYIEDRDLWKWELAHSEIINEALRSYNLTFEFFDEINSSFPEARLKIEGEALLRAKNKIVQQICNNAYPIMLFEHNGLTVNSGVYMSEIGQELAKRSGTFGECFFIQKDGTEIHSLRSIGDFDVSNLAKKLGGGGHKNAAGYTIKKEK